jgi:hypothetical protein
MLTASDRRSDSGGTHAALRAACETLRTAPERVTAVTVTGRLPPLTGSGLPILAAGQRLAAEYEFGVELRLFGTAFEIRFSRLSPEQAPRAG